MSRKFTAAALLAGSVLILSAPAQAAAQDASQIEDLQAKIELLQSQVTALQEALESVKAQQSKAVPSWKGAPESADKASGFTFTPKG